MYEIGISIDSLRERALHQMRANARSGYDRHYRAEYSYVMPSPGRYTWQWFWDSCFHAVALGRIAPDMAKRELETLLTPQRSDGFLGHITYWGRLGSVLGTLFGQSRIQEWRGRNSGIIQPPVLAQALLSVWRATGDDHFMNAMLPKVEAYYEWLARHRDEKSDGLIGVISPYECGLDNSPAYDSALGLDKPTRRSLLWKNWMLDWHNSLLGRGHDYSRLLRRNRMIMIDPFMNAVYADGWDAIGIMHRHRGETELADRAQAMCNKTMQSLNQRCWDDSQGYWIHLRGAERHPETTLTIASIFPLIIGDMDSSKVSRVVEDHLLHPDRFWTPYPVPSVAASEPTFDPESEDCIWRGPVCLNLNWLLARGLRRHGMTEAAEEIEQKSIEMASKDFREFYSPMSGRGMRGTDFGWATVAVDMPAIDLAAH